MTRKTKPPHDVLLGVWHKRVLYAAVLALWLTGVLWLLKASWQPLVMRIHGAAAMAFLLAFGALLVRHVPLGWQRERQRPSGGFLITLSAVLVVTGWGLYYEVDRGLRDWTGKIHWVIGLLFPLFIILHIILGRRDS